MSYELGELRIEDNVCQKLVYIRRKKEELELGWTEVVKYFLEHTLLKIDGEWVKASSLFKPNEYPMNIKDEIEVLKKG